MTVRDLITASLRLIGAVAPSESLASHEATEGLATLNRMLSAWSTEKLNIYATVRESFTLTPGTQQYTMGPSGTFNTTRPVRIVSAAIRDESQSPAVEYPVEIVSLQQWQNITVKGMSASLPDRLFAEGSYPLETINIFPNPTIANKLVIWSDKPISSFASIDTEISLPPGYEEALIFNLCIRIAPEYGKVVPNEVGLIAIESKANIKKLNHRISYMEVDIALLRDRAFNILTGGYE